MNLLWINLLGLALILFIIYWFWLSEWFVNSSSDNKVLENPEQTNLNPSPTSALIEIKLEHGAYQPSILTIAAHQPTSLSFYRLDPAACAEILEIPDLSISETLPLDKQKIISLPPLDIGTYPFHCQMNMYQGRIHVK